MVVGVVVGDDDVHLQQQQQHYYCVMLHGTNDVVLFLQRMDVNKFGHLYYYYEVTTTMPSRNIFLFEGVATSVLGSWILVLTGIKREILKKSLFIKFARFLDIFSGVSSGSRKGLNLSFNSEQ
jgi:hypothetical protein